MKKNLSSILVSVMVLVFMVYFTGCKDFRSNLEANRHLKSANKYYRDEVYKNAVKEYEAALALNPKLTFIYKYLGTGCSQIYRPGKEDPRIKDYGDKAIEYLKKALELEPDNDKIIVGLGDIYDKMGNIDEAEKYYLQILKKAKDEPKSYYTLANFYQKNGKTEAAEEMYLRRIELNPEDPEGYHYFVTFLQDARRWSELLVVHKKRLYAILNPVIIKTMREIDKLGKDAENIQKVTEFMDTVKKNKVISEEERQRLLTESQQRLAGLLSLADTNKRIEELKGDLEKQIKRAEAAIETLDDEQKQTVAEIYYSIGNVCWNWSYQTPANMMEPNEREKIISEGLAALQKATDLAPDYADPIAYMGLLWRERIKISPMKAEEYKKKNDEYIKKFTEIYTKTRDREKRKEELEKLGEGK